MRTSDRHPSRTCVRAGIAALAAVPALLSTAACTCKPAGTDSGSDAGTDAGPPTTIDELPIDVEYVFAELTDPVDVVRDVWGVPHLYGTNLRDVAFANGFIHAMDRLPQMLLWRAFAKGELARLAGALSADLVDRDIVMRTIGLHRAAAAIDALIDPASELRAALDGYADGVNAYVGMLQRFEATLPAGTEFFNVAYIQPWTPVDSLAFARLETFDLTFDAADDLSMTAAFQAMVAAFDAADPLTDPDAAARAGLWSDARWFAPPNPTTVLPGVPNYPTDTGTRALVAAGGPRPWIANEVLEDASGTLAAAFRSPFNPFRAADRGSNNWIVSGAHTESGAPLLANDPHLGLDQPSTFYELQIDLTRGGTAEPSAAGVSFPCAPGVVLGHNRYLAWGSTTADFDVTDVYRETVVDCPTGGTLNCVMFEGAPVAIETIQEVIEVGVGGQVLSTVTVPVEIVPHHGPVIPEVSGGAVVPRSTNEALTYRWTGFEPSLEVGAFLALMRATTVAEAEDALDLFEVGAQNFVVISSDGDLFYSAQARIPVRAPAAYDFAYETNPTGNAPFFVLDGGGSFEWTGNMDERYVPHAVNPAEGFVITANNDQVGTSLDDDPLHGSPDAVDFYYGYNFDVGFRAGRIRELITSRIAGADGVVGTADDGTLSFEDLQAIQGDNQSALGRRLTPFLLESVAALEAHLDGSAPRPDLAAFALAIDPATLDAVREAADRLRAWAGPSCDDGVHGLGEPCYRATDGVEIEAETTGAGLDPADDLDASVATSIFNRWLTRAARATFDDEVAFAGHDFRRLPALLFAVENPNDVRVSRIGATGDSIVFDDMATPSTVETRDLVFLTALADALDDLANTCCTAFDSAGFGTADMSLWRWGLLHTLRLESLVPSLAMVNVLDYPSPEDPLYGEAGTLSYGWPRHGDLNGIDAANFGLLGFDYTYSSGPNMRMVVEMDAQDVLRSENVVPGGAVYDSTSPHFGDLAELWRRNETHPVAFWERDVAAAASSRMVLRPGGS